MSDVIRFTNGYLAMSDGQAIIADLFISPSSGLIISGQSSFFSSRQLPARTVDLGGNILSPGLIDVQINGAYGIDFSEIDLDDPDAERKYTEGLDEVARRLVEMGTTSFVPTVITQEERLYRKLLRLLRPRSRPGHAHILGYHAEGPFLHPLRRGAHSQTLLMTATASPPIQTFEQVYGAEGLDQEGVKLITLAPDVEGVMGCVEELTRRGVTVSIGHSDASLQVASEAVDKGARMITHLFKHVSNNYADWIGVLTSSAMPPIHHRDPGVIGLLGDPSRSPYYGIIVDGLHSHPNTVRIAYGAKKEGCILVTDAQSPMDPNLPDGEHQWGTRPGVTFRKEGHAVYVGGTTTLAGSCCPLNECLQNLSTYASIPLPEAILTATMRPAQMLGPAIAEHKGKLEEGFDADLCILGWDGSVKSTWIMGHEVWRTEQLGDVGEGDYLGSVFRGKEGLVNGH